MSEKLTDIETTLNRIKSNKSVRFILLCNNEGKVVRKIVNEDKKDDGDNFAKVIPQLVTKAQTTIRDLEANNELTFMRIKSKNYEIMISPDKDFIVIVVQDLKMDTKKEDGNENR